VANKVLERLNLMAAHRRISSTDKVNLQNHLDILNDIRGRLTQVDPLNCSAPALAFFGKGDSYAKQYSNLNDIVVSAFACDITRIACLNVSNHADYTFSGGLDHGLSHINDTEVEKLQQFTDLRNWMGQRIADLINKLAARTDFDGSSMLDNTVLVWGSDMINIHKMESIPIMVAGNAQGRLNSGYYIDFRRRPFKRLYGPPIGVCYTQLLCTLMKTAGLQPEEYRTGGEGGFFGQYELTNRFRPESAYADVAPFRNDPLPFFYKT
jgi:hypothetical protein